MQFCGVEGMPLRITDGLKRSLSLIVAIFLVGGCTKSPSPGPGAETTGNDKSAGKGIKVGLVLDKGGKDDRSFNSAAVRGASQAVSELGIQLKDVECSDDAAFEPALRTFAERGYPLVIAIGFAQSDAVKKVASQFPNTSFALADGRVEAANVASLLFAEHEGSYLVGYLAGLATKTGRVGFIGGMDIPLIRRFQMGYEAGVKAARPGAEILVNYVGVNSAAWANPSRGKELALGQYARNADIVYHAAGASGLGVFDAAEEKSKFVIGVDSNQNGVKPGRVLTSMLKRVDTAVYAVIKEMSEGHFKSGTRYFGLADKGIDFAVDENNKSLVSPYLDKVEQVRGKIMSGELKIPDYYVVGKAN